MPINAAAAQQLIQERGVQPPEGIQPGSPQYDQWATEWLKGAVNSGDPAAVQAAGGVALGQGGTQSGAEIAGGNVLDPGGQNAAAHSEWGGKRNPTPSELRRYAREAGWSEDFNRFSDRQMAAWIDESWDQSTNKFQGGVEKPTETGGSSAPRGGGGGGGGRGGGGRGGGGGRWGQGNIGSLAGGAPTLELPEFVAPTAEEALSEPGYQAALQQGQQALEGSAAARGTLRTGGTLRDLVDYGQQAAGQQYGNVFNRALQGYGANVGAQQAQFAPQMQAWQTQYGGNLQQALQGNQLGYNRWATQYGGDLSKYLQKESNIFGLLNQAPPQYPGY